MINEDTKSKQFVDVSLEKAEAKIEEARALHKAGQASLISIYITEQEIVTTVEGVGTGTNAVVGLKTAKFVDGLTALMTLFSKKTEKCQTVKPKVTH